MRAVPVRPALKRWYPSGEPSAAPSPCLLHSFVECATPAAVVHLAVHAFATSQQIASVKLNAAASTQACEADTKVVRTAKWLLCLASCQAIILAWLGLAQAMLCHAMLFHATPCHAALCFAMLNHAILTHGLLRHAEVFHVMLYHAVTC